MSRDARSFSDVGIYHIMFRGTNKQPIFLSDWDYMKMLEILEHLKEKFGFELYAYCMMQNHVHFVIKEKGLRDISMIMHGLLTKYSRWFNLKYERTGTLMENRYKSKVVDNNEYFQHLIRYVHQNPVKAGLVNRVDEYSWSSYNDYLKAKDGMLTDTDFLFEILPKKEFTRFHLEEEESEFELFKNITMNDSELIYELKNLGVSPPERLSYLPDEEVRIILEKLNRKFSSRHIVRVTGISDYRLRKLKNG